MAVIAVVGEHPRVDGFALAGARVLVACTPGDLQAAWDTLPEEAVVVLTPAAAAALDDRIRDRTEHRRLTVVMPA